MFNADGYNLLRLISLDLPGPPETRRFSRFRVNAVNNPVLTVDDAQLLRRIARQDRSAFSQLYDRYATILYSTILRVLDNQDEAAEVMQDVFAQIWEKAGMFDPVAGHPFNWILTFARRAAIDRLRAQKRCYSFVEEIAQELKSDTNFFDRGTAEIFGREKASMIRAVVETLPLEQRQAIEMAFLGGLTQNEVSEILRQPLGIIKARIRRGMLILRESLKDRL
jgi:RNA polymerase sigma-70 factor (ECF subfamily)